MWVILILHTSDCVVGLGVASATEGQGVLGLGVGEEVALYQ